MLFPTIALPFVLSFVACSPDAPSSNVLLITLDTTRADRLGCFGYDAAHTPHLDELAASSVRFDEALTAVPVTLPAHSTILTGQYPLRHGVRNNGSYSLRADRRTLAEVFSEHGYETAGFVSAYVLDQSFGTGQGFSTYDDELFNERTGAETTERALRWLADRDGGRPFFLWVHLFDPHLPWTPPEWSRELDLPDDYDREIAEADRCVGDLLQALGSDLENTTVVVVGDHGEGLNDHGEFEHGIFLYPETMRVPFLLHLPEGAHGGKTVTEPVATADIFPTLLEITSVPARSGSTTSPAEEIDGASLLPLIETGTPPQRRGIYMETVYPEENFGWAPLTAFRSQQWKWIDAPRPELFDHANDPLETINLRESRPDDARSLGDRLARFVAGFPELPSQAPQDLSPEAEERLRSLGYLSGGSEIDDSGPRPDPKDMIAIHEDYEAAKKAMDETRFADAVPHFRTVLEHNPENHTARLGLGTALVRISEYEEAKDVLGPALEARPRNTTVQAALADAAFGLFDYQGALELYRLAEADPSLGTRHVPSRIVTCLHRLGRSAEARELLQRYAGRPEDAGFWRDFEGRLSRDAAVSARIAPDADPSAVTGPEVLDRALASAAVGITAEAVRWLQTPVQPAEAEAKRLEYLARLYAESRRPALALEALASLQAAGVDTSPLQPLEARLLAETGQWTAALQAYEALPATLEREHARIRTLAELGRMEEALQVLDGLESAGQLDFSKLLVAPEFQTLREDPAFIDWRATRR